MTKNVKRCILSQQNKIIPTNYFNVSVIVGVQSHCNNLFVVLSKTGCPTLTFVTAKAQQLSFVQLCVTDSFLFSVALSAVRPRCTQTTCQTPALSLCFTMRHGAPCCGLFTVSLIVLPDTCQWKLCSSTIPASEVGSQSALWLSRNAQKIPDTVSGSIKG